MKITQHRVVAATLVAVTATIVGLGIFTTFRPSDTTAANGEQFEALAVSESSLNGNTIWGATEAWQAVVSAGGLDEYAAFFHENRASQYQGLSSTGATNIDGVPYHFNWTGTDTYDGNDTIRLYSAHPSNTVALETIGVYKQIYVLATAGGPGEGHYANFSVILNYTDGTSDTTSYRVYDWFDATPVANVYKHSGIKRRELKSGDYGATGVNAAKPFLQSATIAVDSNKLLKSIDLVLTGKDGGSDTSGIYCGIYALTGMVDNSVPNAPLATPATDITTHSFVANWELTPGADSYRLDIATDKNFTNILSDYNNLPVEGTAFTVTDLRDDLDYYYRVRAVNTNGQSLSSNTIDVTTFYDDITPPTITVIGDTTTIKTSDTLHISAADRSGVESLEFSRDGGFTWETLDSSSNQAIEITTNDTYLIRATDTAGNTTATQITYSNLDTVRPVVAIDTHGYQPDTWTNSNIILSVSNTATNLGPTRYQFSTDGTNWQEYTNPIIITNETTPSGETYYFKAISQAGLESEPVNVTVKKDNTAPTGTITSDENSWNSFLHTLTFGLFFNETKNFTIAAEDNASGIAGVKYLITDQSFQTADAALEADGWRDTTNGGSVAVDPEQDFAIYYQIIDGAGNISIINSNGIVLDTIPALIQGYALGQTYDLQDDQTYYLTQKLLITDNKQLGSLLINGEYIEIPADGVITLSGNRATDNFITVTDKAGNITNLIVHTGAIAELLTDVDLAYATSDDINKLQQNSDALLNLLYQYGAEATASEKGLINDHLTALAETTDLLKLLAADLSQIETQYAELPNIDHITADYDAAIDALTGKISDILEQQNNHLTPAERARLYEILDHLQHLSDRIYETEKRYDNALSQSDHYSPANVNIGDEAAIQQLLAEINDLLAHDNLTDDQRTNLEATAERLHGALDRITALKQAIADAVKNNPTVGATPTVTPENVTRQHRRQLEDASAGYAGVLGEYATNLTPNESATLQGGIASINATLDLLDSIAFVEDLFAKLPAASDVSLENQPAIEKAKAAYEALSEHAKGLLDPALVAKYNAALSALYLFINGMPASFAIETLDIFWWGIITLAIVGACICIAIYIRRKRLDAAEAERRHDAAKNSAK